MAPVIEDSPGYVVRLRRTADWNLIRGGRAVASAHGLCRPDGRWFVSIDAWDDSAYAPLFRAMDEDLRQDLYTNLSADDVEGLTRWQRFGFSVARRETLYEVPVDPAVTGLDEAPLPDGIVLVPADAVDEDRLRELDDTLRQDVPGTDGWASDPMEFREQTFDERYFDPSAYLVAVDDAHKTFAGLVRVWNHPRLARLGLIGVVPAYRRRGLARAMLGAAFGPVYERGNATVTAEAAVTNLASTALLESIGARRTGETLALLRARRG